MTVVVAVARAVVERRAGSDEIAAAVASTALPVGKAGQVVRFVEQVRTVADPADLQEWVAGLVDAASDDVTPDATPDVTPDVTPDGTPGATPGAAAGRGRCRGIGEGELAVALRQAVRLVRPLRDLEDLERRQRLGRGLTRTDGGGSESGMAHYRLTLDPERAAVLDSAVSALSAPRRADALLDLVGRAVAAGGGDGGGDGPTGSGGGPSCPGGGGGLVPGVGERAQVVVTIGYEALLEGVRGRG